METYKKWLIPALISAVFVIIAILLSLYILSLPLATITSKGCAGFSGYQLGNCIAYYQRLGDVATLQQDAEIALWILWCGLITGTACSFSVFPRISLSRTLKTNILLSGLLLALLLAGLPFFLLTDLIINGFIFTLSFLVIFLTIELTLISSTNVATSIEETVLSTILL